MARLLEFPPAEGEKIATPEEICAQLAPVIQTEAELQHLLSQVEPDKRAMIEKCLRANGACKEPEHPAC